MVRYVRVPFVAALSDQRVDIAAEHVVFFEGRLSRASVVFVLEQLASALSRAEAYLLRIES